MEQQLLFVYGLLLNKEECEVSQLVSKQTQVLGHGYFHGQLYNIGWYPGALYRPQNAEKVFGSIIQVNDAPHTLAKLDDFEGIGPNWEQPHEYNRELIQAFYADGTPANCWCYIYMYTVAPQSRIPSGDYYAYRKLIDAR